MRFKKEDSSYFSYLFLAAGLVLTILLYFVLENSQKNNFKEKLELLSKNSILMMTEKINNYKNTLELSSAFFASSDEVTRDEWLSFVKSINLEKTIPGAISMGYAYHVLKDELESHIITIKKSGLQGYTIRPEGMRVRYAPVVYTEPYNQINMRMIGFDLLSQVGTREAINHAIASDSYGFSRKIRFSDGIRSGDNEGFMFVLPVYQKAQSVATYSDRERSTIGYLYINVAANAFLHSLFTDDFSFLKFSITDEGTNELLYDNTGEQDEEFYYESIINIGGRTLSIKSAPSAIFTELNTQNSHLYASFATLIFTLIVFVYLQFYRKDALLEIEGLKDSLRALRGERVELKSEISEYQEKSAKYSKIFEMLDSGAVIYGVVGDGEDFIFRDINSAVEKIDGVKKDEILGARVTVIFPGVISMGLFEVFKRVHKSGTPEHFPIGFYKDAKLQGWRDNYVFKLNQGEIVSIYHDNTDVMKQKEELIITKELAEEASRVKSQFLSNMNHEIRTPMNAIIGFLDLLGMTKLDEKQKEYLKIIKLSSRGLMSTIDDIIDISMFGSNSFRLEKQVFNLHEIIENQHRKHLSSAKEKGLKFSMIIDESTPGLVVGDALRLSQILSNLLSNAIKFTDAGSVTFSAKELSSDENSHVIGFSVQDSGIGIDEERAKYIFEPFAQVDSSDSRKHGGSGVGLAICKKLVTLMDGDIAVNSALGGGSIFTFSVTFKRGPKESSIIKSLNSAPKKAIKDSILKILIAEDNELNQNLLVQIFEKRGIQSKIANNGQEALDALDGESFDAVIMDMQMPVMDGVSAIKKIREQERFKNLPIIALTATTLDEDREECLNAGANEFLTKPVSIKDIMDCIKKYLSIGDETQKTGDKGTIEIAGFEIDAAMKRLGVPAEFIYTQLMSFAQSYRDSTELFDDMLRRDAKEAAAFVHKIKGSAGTIGIDSIHACAVRLEPKLKAGEVDYELVDEFKTIMREAIEQIDTKISIKNQEVTQDADVNIAKSQLFELKELLQKRGYILVAKQNEVFSLIAPLIDGYLLDRLKDELGAFQYERALLSIEEIFRVINKNELYKE